MQHLVVDMIQSGVLRVHRSGDNEMWRILELMEQYQDRPMDLADASLIALAEAEGYRRIFSLDNNFYIYRLPDGSTLEIVPGPLERR